MVTGYGEFRPLLENSNDVNRAANRRVEIKILKAIEVAKKEAQDTGQAGGSALGGKLASESKASEPSSTPQQNK